MEIFIVLKNTYEFDGMLWNCTSTEPVKAFKNEQEAENLANSLSKEEAARLEELEDEDGNVDLFDDDRQYSYSVGVTTLE